MLGVPFLDHAIFKWFRPHLLDDPVDRLNYFATSTMLGFFAIMVSAKQFVGSPIQCWAPNEFRGGWEQYAEDFCFIQNTYYIPQMEDIPKGDDEREQAEIGYYQWVPIVLAIQAIMFFIPNWIWQTLNRQSGIDLSVTVADARKLRSFSFADRKEAVAKLTQYLAECLGIGSERTGYRRFMWFRVGNNLNSYVSCLYLFTKFMYLLNVITQFYLLNHFLGTNGILYGFDIMKSLLSGHDWEESGLFPRVTLCDFSIRRTGSNLHRYTVQCVLMINMFNEKIYLFLWFWFMAVMLITMINFIYCVFHIALSRTREDSARGWLSHITNQDDAFPREDLIIRKFVNNGLQPDGYLVLRFIEGHAGAMVARDLAHQLYKMYLETQHQFAPTRIGGGASTKSVSPGGDDGHHEQLYNPEKLASLMQTDYKH